MFCLRISMHFVLPCYRKHSTRAASFLCPGRRPEESEFEGMLSKQVLL